MITKSALLGRTLTADYRPSVMGISARWRDHRGAFSFWDIEIMRRDPRIRLGLRIIKSPIAVVKWKVNSENQAVAEWVDKQLKHLWRAELGRLLLMIDYGRAGGEVVWRLDEETDLVNVHELKHVYSTDMQPLELHGEFWGLRINGAGEDAPIGKCFYLVNDPELNPYYGRSRMLGAWEPWSEKSNRHGAKDIRRLWYAKNAFRGGMMRHPPGSVSLDGGDTKSNQDYAREIAEKIETGGILVLPGAKDAESGEFLWTYEEPKINGDLGGVREYVKDLDGEIFEGLEIPIEIIEAQQSGSWAGRTVPFLVFLTGEDAIADNLITSLDRHILRPGAEANFGRGVKYEIEIESLVPKDEQQPGEAGPAGGDPNDALASLLGGGGGGADGGKQPYQGPRGGSGFKDPVTGKVSYGEQMSVERLAQGEEWSRYEGPHGGHGWKNATTGEVVYQEAMPGGSEAKPAAEAKVPAFTNGLEGEEWGFKNYNGEAWLDKLTPAQQKSLKNYVTNSSRINGALRGIDNDPGALQAAAAHAPNIDAALAVRPVPEPVSVWRGLAAHANRDWDSLVGTTFEDKGYLSGSVDPNEARWHADPADRGGAMMRVSVPAGTPGAYLGVAEFSSSERELLLGRGLRYRVAAVHEPGTPGNPFRGKQKYLVVDIEVVPAGSANLSVERLGNADRLAVGDADPWEAYVGKRGSRKGQQGWKNRITHRIAWGAKPRRWHAPAQRPALEGMQARAGQMLQGGPLHPDHVRDFVEEMLHMSAKDMRALASHLGSGTGHAKADLAQKIKDIVEGRKQGKSKEERDKKVAHLQKKTASEAQPWTGKGEPDLGKVYNAPTGDLQIDPSRFQFKLNVDSESGVTQELKSVKTWNPDFAGVVSVWKDPADGKTYVVNGHHRRELAGRLGVDNLAVRYIKAGSAQEARAIGALINIAEGRGTAVDAAKFMRDTGQGPEALEKHGVSLKGKVAADAATLTRLNDRLFDRVARGVLDESKALSVAKHLPNHDLQDSLFRLLDKREEEGKDLSPKVIEEMAREMAATPTHTKSETSLFGDIESEESLFVERNELKSFVRGELAKDVNDFLAVASKKRAEKIGKAGNVIDPEENRRIADEAARVKATFDTLVNSKGEISDALNKAAADYAKAKGKKERDAIKQRATEAVKQAVFKEAGVGEGPAAGPDTGAVGSGVGGGEATPGGEPQEPAVVARDAGRGETEPAGLTGEQAGQPEAKPVSEAAGPQAASERAAEADSTASDAGHLTALQSIGEGDLGRVGGVNVRRTGKDAYRVEVPAGIKVLAGLQTEDERRAGVVRGDAAKIARYLDHVGQHDKMFGRGRTDALARAEGFEEPSFMDAAGLEKARKGFEALPEGAAVVSLEPHSHGRVGRIVVDEDGRKRVRLDGEDGWASSYVEPLDVRHSWRVDRSKEPEGPKQASMFDAPAAEVPKAAVEKPAIPAQHDNYGQQALTADGGAAKIHSGGEDQAGGKNMLRDTIKPAAKLAGDESPASDKQAAYLQSLAEKVREKFSAAAAKQGFSRALDAIDIENTDIMTQGQRDEYLDNGEVLAGVDHAAVHGIINEALPSIAMLGQKSASVWIDALSGNLGGSLDGIVKALAFTHGENESKINAPRSARPSVALKQALKDAARRAVQEYFASRKNGAR